MYTSFILYKYIWSDMDLFWYNVHALYMLYELNYTNRRIYKEVYKYFFLSYDTNRIFFLRNVFFIFNVRNSYFNIKYIFTYDMNRGTFCPTYKTFAINNPDQTHVTRPVKIGAKARRP